MSRVGKKPIKIVEGVKVAVEKTALVVSGPKGTLTLDRIPNLDIVREDDVLKVVIPASNRKRNSDSLQGLQQSLLQNMVTGVSAGFSKVLKLSGVGYRAEKSGDKLILRLGYSNDIVYRIPPGVVTDVEKNGLTITISGPDKQKVGSVAQKIRSFRPVEPYKGKGIRYADEVVRRKEGKSK